MHIQGANLAIAALTLSRVGHALKATILADTNRDGTVDVASDSDTRDKNVWTETHGAIFMANIGDTNGRCSMNITDKTPNEDLERCNDASDNTLRNPMYLAPLRTLPISTLSETANGTLSVHPAEVAAKVRLFHKSSGGWLYIDESHSFSAQDLRKGLQVGIDGRDVRRPGVWNGTVAVRLTVNDGTESATDSVALRVAPVLTHHHLQDAEQLITSLGDSGNRVQEKFVSDLREAAKHVGLQTPLITLNTSDLWTQDFFEPCYTSMPGPNGPVVLRIMVRSSQDDRDAGRLVFTQLRSATVGAVQWLAEGASQDSFGNLETIPPYSHGGAHYPAGRAFMGIQDESPPHALAFLDAQETQKPIRLDTSWLYVGHVDEFMQFIPANNTRGWALVIDDPRAGVENLRTLQKQGHGDRPFLSRPVFPTDPSYARLPNQTVTDLLNLGNLTTFNYFCAGRIAANLEILKREIGLADDEIVRLPALFYDPDQFDNFPRTEPLEDGADTDAQGPALASASAGASADASAAASVPDCLSIVDAASPKAKLSRRSSGAVKLVAAFNSGVVNGIVINRDHYMAPNPWGPVVNGRDVQADEVTALYGSLQKTVHFIDNWYSHHVLQGEIHCGSNTLRGANDAWWSTPAPNA